MSEEETTPVYTEDIIALVQASNKLAVNLHRMLEEEMQNVFFSPLCVSTAMSVLLCAADGETASEIWSSLGFDDPGVKKEDVAAIFKEEMSAVLKAPNSYTLLFSNAMLSRKGIVIKDAFKKVLFESFKALLWEVDVTEEREKSVVLINEWVREKTNNMIPQIVQSLDPKTVFVFINAIYFKGTWVKKFDKERTHSQTFYNKGIEDNGKDVDMMEMIQKFPFYEDDTLQALQMPYIGEEVVMLILLPRERDGLEAVEKSLSPSMVQDFKLKLSEQDVIISLPRFRLEYEKSLVSCFQKLGIQSAFTEEADLRNASDSPELVISDILHKAVLEVNEEGSEEAAASEPSIADTIGVTKIDPPVFTADHPFAFIIYNTTSFVILFMGRVYEL